MLELKNLSAGYGDQTVLRDVSLALPRGTLTTIVGENGCGKSTLLKAMVGLLPHASGEILVDGVSLSDMKRNEIAQRIAYLSQGKSTPDMTVSQMVLHGRFSYLSYPRRYKAYDREVARGAMETVGITHLADKPLCELSGGMRQNAYLAMALAQQTDYVLLDEPTTYLDVSHQLDLMRLLRSLADAGRGIVAVMHDLPLAFDFSDSVAVIRDGGIAAYGAPQTLSDSPVIRETFGVEVSRAEDGHFHYRY